MMLRSVAGDKDRFSKRARLSEPTGSPVAMWSWIRDFSTSRLRSSKSVVIYVRDRARQTAPPQIIRAAVVRASVERRLSAAQDIRQQRGRPALGDLAHGREKRQPAPACTTTWWRLSTRALTPPGTRPTRCSFSLISRTQPMRSLFTGVDLRSLQRPAVIDVDRLPFGEDIQRLDAGLAVAVAGVLGAAEGQVGLRPDGGRVHVEDPGVHVAHGREGLVDVLGVDRRGQAVLDGVADGDGLLQGADGDDRDHGAEDLLHGHAHAGVAVAEDRGLMEPTASERAFLQAVAAAEELGALVLADLDVALHGAALRVADAGPHLDRFVQPVPDLQGPGAFHEAVHELPVDFLVDGQPAGRGAPLAGGPDAAPGGAVHRQVPPGVG